MRPPPSFVLVAALGATALLGGCSGSGDDAPASPAPVTSAAGTGASTGSQQPAQPCERTAVVDGVRYHERGVYGDYQVDTSVELSAPVSPCAGVEGEPATFHPVVGVRRQWALVAEVGDQEVFFLTDRLPPIPTDSEFARILIGDQADTR